MEKPPEFEQLASDVDVLLAKLADVKDVGLQMLRDRVRSALRKLRAGVAQASAQGSATLKNSATAVDDYTHESPWVVVGVAAAVGIGIGLLLGRASAPRKSFW